eukprot:Lankesteria_metandrocarpae@DN5383_c1_g1_i1.p1
MVDFVLGKPTTQRQSLIIDTGSSVLAFACTGCGSGCGNHQDPKFSLELSDSDTEVLCGTERTNSGSTCNQCGIKQNDCVNCSGSASLRGGNAVLHEDKCAYTIHYLEGSHLNGLWYSDVIWLGHGPAKSNVSHNDVGVPVRVPFGCHLEETNLFVTQKAAGIIGMEKQTSFGPQPFIKAALGELSDLGFKNLPLYGFSICFSQQGGVFSVGKSNVEHHVLSTTQRSLNEGTQRKDVVVSAWMPAELFMSAKNALPSNQPPVSVDTLGIDTLRALQRAGPTESSPVEGNMIVPVHAMSGETVIIDGNRVDKEIPKNNSKKEGDDHKFSEIKWVDVIPGKEYHLKVESFGVGSRMFHPQHAKTGEKGMIALLDSGTTIFYLRWIIYAETVFEIERVVTESIKQQIETKSGAALDQDEERIMIGHSALPTNDGKIPVHLSGWTFNDMKRVTDDYVTNMTRVADFTDILAESVLLPEFRYEPTHHNGGGRSLNAEEEASNLRAVKESLESYVEGLRLLRQKLDDMEGETILRESEAAKKAESQGRNLADVERTWFTRNTLQSMAVNGGRVSAEVNDNLQSLSNHPSAHQRSSLTISKLSDSLGEECWSLPNFDDDLRHFPKIVIVFGGGVEFMWEPSSYLYRKGNANVYCLAIAPQGLDPNEAESSDSAASMMHLFGHEAVLGSSFFINHDIVFDLEDPLVHDPASGGRVGFVPATCPTYKLSERPVHSAFAAEIYNDVYQSAQGL